MANFRAKQEKFDLLAFNNTIFERDFVEFTMNNSALEHQIQEFMAASIQSMASIDKQLQFMAQFQQVLSRDALKEDLVRHDTLPLPLPIGSAAPLTCCFCCCACCPAAGAPPARTGSQVSDDL
jgi:hypothetical protein